MCESTWNSTLAALTERGLYRSLRRVESGQGPTFRLDGREVINFGSNDYLCLAADPRVIEAAQRAASEFGWGAGASRLVCGTYTAHTQLEDRLASFCRTERALVFGSGYLANLAALAAAAGKDDLVFSDQRNHASIIDAIKLSGARTVIYPHRDYDALERLLCDHAGPGHKTIVTDSLFSVDGCPASLPKLVELKERYNATLCVDEAHAFGVYGEHGRGLAEMQDVEAHTDVRVATLSKAFGGTGGVIYGSNTLIEYLINTARPFIFSTAPPPAACAAALAALDIIESDEGRQLRRKVLATAERLRGELGEVRGHDLSTTTTHIIPLIIGDPTQTVDSSTRLLDHGIFAPPFRPPSVPEGTSRLRISVTAGHRPAHIDALLAAIDRLVPSPHKA